MIVLDASVLIGFLEDADPHHRAAENLFDRLVDDDLAVNPLTLAEVLARPARVGRLSQVLEILTDLEVTQLTFPHDAAVRLAELRAFSGLRMPDCCVLMSAEAERAMVATFDARLAGAASARGLTVTGV